MRHRYKVVTEPGLECQSSHSSQPCDIPPTPIRRSFLDTLTYCTADKLMWGNRPAPDTTIPAAPSNKKTADRLALSSASAVSSHHAAFEKCLIDARCNLPRPLEWRSADKEPGETDCEETPMDSEDRAHERMLDDEIIDMFPQDEIVDEDISSIDFNEPIECVLSW